MFTLIEVSQRQAQTMLTSAVSDFDRRPQMAFAVCCRTATALQYLCSMHKLSNVRAQLALLYVLLQQLTLSNCFRLVTRLTIEERMMQQAKKKLVLEHLVVHKMNPAVDLKQVCCQSYTLRVFVVHSLQQHTRTANS